MASSYTGNSGIEKPAEGDQTGEWGDTVNTNMDIIDRSINGVGAITLSGTTHTLTTTDGTLSDGMYKVLVLGGSPSGTNTITIAPNDADKVYIVVNSSGQTATFTQGSGANVSVLNGDSKIIYADGAGSGAAIVDITANLSFSSVNIDGGTIDGTAIGAASASTGAFTTVTASGTLGVTGETTLSTHLNMGDGDIIKLGASADLQIYHDGSNSYIQDTGTGYLVISSDGPGVRINSPTAEVMADFTPDGAVSLYHNNSVKIATASGGVSVTGEVAATSLDISGDVDVDGTLETDALSIASTVVTSTAAELNILDGVTSTAAELNILDGVTSTAAELNILDGVTSTAAELNYLDITTLGTTQASKAVTTDANGDVIFPDGDKIQLGTGSDLTIQHDGANAYFQNTTGNINLQAKSGESSVVAVPDGAVSLYHNNSVKIATASGGITVTGEVAATSLDISGDADIDGTLETDALSIASTAVTATAAELNYLDITTLGTSEASKAVTVDASGDLLVPDSDKFKFGAGSDMQVYHDGTNSYITNATGELKLATESSGIAIAIGHSTSEVTFGDNVTITGDLAVNGTTTTINTTNLTVTDPLVKFGQGYTGTAYDEGFIVTRGDGSSSNTANKGLIWDESADEFAAIACNTEDGTTAGNVTINSYADLQVGKLTGASLDISGDVDVDGTLEADAMTLNGTSITATATLSTGISNTNVPVFTSGVADDDFLRVAGTSIEGRSAAEVLSDIGASAVAGSGSIVTTGALDSGSITSNFGTINNGASTITTSGVVTSGSLLVADAGTIGSASDTDAIAISSAGLVSLSATNALKLNAGTTAQRPTGAAGHIRYNSTLSQFEGYGSAWGSLGGGATGGGSDTVFVENSDDVTTSYTITSGKNAMSVGPITVEAGVVVTIPTGSRWVIL